MPVLDYVFLLLTGLTALYLVWYFIKLPGCEEGKCPCRYYFVVAFLVMLVAGLILIFAGWSALATPFVSVVAGLIPFGIATGLVARHYAGVHKGYLGLMLVGLVLIAIAKFGGFADFARVIYPIFHGIAGLTIVIVPILAVKAGEASGKYIFVAVGGALMGLGGMALAFLSVGKQLLFFSGDVVMAILAPLLFLTTFSFLLGLVKKQEPVAGE